MSQTRNVAGSGSTVQRMERAYIVSPGTARHAPHGESEQVRPPTRRLPVPGSVVGTRTMTVEYYGTVANAPPVPTKRRPRTHIYLFDLFRRQLPVVHSHVLPLKRELPLPIGQILGRDIYIHTHTRTYLVGTSATEGTTRTLADVVTDKTRTFVDSPV